MLSLSCVRNIDSESSGQVIFGDDGHFLPFVAFYPSLRRCASVNAAGLYPSTPPRIVPSLLLVRKWAALGDHNRGGDIGKRPEITMMGDESTGRLQGAGRQAASRASARPDPTPQPQLQACNCLKEHNREHDNKMTGL